MNGGNARAGAWTTIVRTRLIDELLERSLHEGADRVVNLAAGYDTRPFRMSLPPGLRWIEVDSPAVLERKARLLEGNEPGCRVERIPANLADARERARVLDRALEGSERAVVLTEGLLVYLDVADVRGLARALHERGTALWITDLASPLVRRMMKRVERLVTSDARWRFTPAEGVDFFVPLGWEPCDVLPVIREARRLGRLPWALRLVAPFERDPRRPWGAVVRCRRAHA